MKVQVCAVGRMKSGPEKELADRFFDRLGHAGGGIGLDFAGVIELPEGRAPTTVERQSDEGGRLLSALLPGAALALLDERGRNLSSQQLADHVASMRDSGRKALAFLIGGPDGHGASIREKADLVISFGAATWPHQMARIMLAEQLYRTATILSGHPYHRA